jgi:hypothetical protein
MASKNFLSGDYVSRRGAILTTDGIKNSPTQTTTYDASSVILGEKGLSKSFYNHSDFFLAKQILMSKGMDDTTSNVMAASLLDVAKLKQQNIQTVMGNLFEGTVKNINDLDDSALKCVNHGFITTDRVYFIPKVRSNQGTSLPIGIDEFQDDGVRKTYFVINVSNNYFKIAESELDARRGIFLTLTPSPVTGMIEVHHSIDLRLDMDQYIHMNFLRPTSSQLGIMVRNELEDSVRFKQINP